MEKRNFTYLIIGAVIMLVTLVAIDFNARQASIIDLPDFIAAENNTTAKDVPINSLQDINDAFTSIIDETVPSVVTIEVTQKVEIQRAPLDRFFDGPFGFFQRPGDNNQPQQRVREGLGSGVIVSENGYILTNNHVVEGAESIHVTLYNGKEYDGEVVGRDPLTDIAVVKIDADNLNALEIGNSKAVNVGSMVLAIGSPLRQDLAHSVSFGIISGKGRTIGIIQNNQVAGYENFIQTDAAINPGNSGGALVNMNGELIGINTAIASRSGGNQGIGFAVPSNVANRIMMELIKNGEVERALLGIYGSTVDGTLAEALGLENADGIVVGTVEPGSPADEAGLKDGDAIITLNGEPIDNYNSFRTSIASSEPGSTVTLGVIRDGNEMKIEVTLGKLSNEQTVSTEQEEKNSIQETVGFNVENLTDQIAQQLNLESGQTGVVVTDVSRMSDAYRQGLRRGAVIVEADNQPVNNVSDFKEIIGDMEEGQAVLLKIVIQGISQYVAFEL